ncbi:MAG: PEP-CTERM sorting domain-containing protein [Armatimonadetes bacterium]|nr:PEP-CTERM sorting domain-containing protein [Armatimonadota bacterium]
MIKLRIALGTFMVSAGLGSYAGTFSDSFASGLDSNYWTVTQTTANRYSVDTSGGNLKLYKGSSAGSGSLQGIYLTLNMAAIGGSVSGDFVQEVSFDHAQLSTLGVTQVELHANFADSSIFFDVYDNSSGKNFHVWDGGIHGLVGTSLTAATLKIARVGSTISGYYNGNLIYAGSNTSALSAVRLAFQTQPNEGGAAQSVNFSNFSISGSSVVPEPATMAALTVGFLASVVRRRRA